MGMASDNDIQAFGLRDNGLIHIVAEMAEKYDKLAFFLLAEMGCPLVHHFHIVQLPNALGSGSGHHGGDIRLHPDNANTYPTSFYDGSRSNVLLKYVGEFAVGAHYWTFYLAQALGKALYSFIELVVTEGDAVVSESIYHLGLQRATQFAVVGCPLIEVAGVKKQHLVGRILGADAVDERGPLDYAAKPVRFSPAYGVEMAVRIIGMDDYQTGLASYGRKAYKHGNYYLLHRLSSTIETRPSVL